MWEMWLTRFSCSYFFDVASSPYFEIMYIYSVFAIPTCAGCIVAIDILFMGLCMHTVALIKDFKENLARVDREAKTDEDFKMQMSQQIKYHIEILELTRQIESVFNRMFFLEFFGTTFILCSQSYLTAMV